MYFLRISTLVGSLLLLTPIRTDACDVPQAEVPPARPPLQQVRQRARALLQQEARGESKSVRAGHVLRMVELVGDIAQDPRLETSPTLQRVRGWLVSRLRRFKKELERDLRQGREPLAHIKIDRQILAQLNAPPGGPAAPGANAAGNPPDYGPLLVALIQETISPASWDVNGGKSTIVYYRPGRALVVRAPPPLHGQLRPVLGQLRR